MENNLEHMELIIKNTRESTEVVGNALRSIYDRITEEALNTIALEWNTYDDEKKKEVAALYAGRHQSGKFHALLDGLSNTAMPKGEG
ncbi:hypothetical protein [Paenibacillus sp. QZ-Y1]|uniref:hypothetical protein n=1 Tax=Paenibacillus sp. QZ-Y1 TaxID=3414511 RepID=UPI003F79C10B